MNKVYIGIVLLVLIVGWAFYYAKPIKHTAQDSRPGAVFVLKTNVSENQNIIIDTPKADTDISSPFVITGKAKGGWFFEGSFPIELRDMDGNLLETSIAKADGEWMTNDFVPFTAELTFKKPARATSATLVFKKDNPSGLPENDESIEIPIIIN